MMEGRQNGIEGKVKEREDEIQTRMSTCVTGLNRSSDI